MQVGKRIRGLFGRFRQKEEAHAEKNIEKEYLHIDNSSPAGEEVIVPKIFDKTEV